MSGTMLDCRGLACPEPVLRVKDALERGAAVLAVVVDNEAACQNVQRFAGTRGCRVEVHPQGEGVSTAPQSRAAAFPPQDLLEKILIENTSIAKTPTVPNVPPTKPPS